MCLVGNQLRLHFKAAKVWQPCSIWQPCVARLAAREFYFFQAVRKNRTQLPCMMAFTSASG